MKLILRDLFGVTLNNLVGTQNKVKITEHSGEITEGVVNGYSNSYTLTDGTVKNAAVGIIRDDLQLARVELNNISELYIDN